MLWYALRDPRVRFDTLLVRSVTGSRSAISPTRAIRIDARGEVGVLDSGLQQPPVAITIAGSDPSGGAGLQADLKTFHQFGVYGMAVPTLLTVQNTRAVESVLELDPDLVRAQLECIGRDIPAAAGKTGALGRAGTVRAVADWAKAHEVRLVVDPVMVSTHGDALVSTSALGAIVRHLLPVSFLVTPNLHEAGSLAGLDVGDIASMRVAAERISALGARRVLVKGGHLGGDAVDLLWIDGETSTYSSERIRTSCTHGTGCTYSAAIAALLAQGRAPADAVARAKRYLTEAIRTAPRLGGGQGPVNHHAPVR